MPTPMATPDSRSDQPSLLIASYNNPDIAAAGKELTSRLAALIELLGGEVPDQPWEQGI
jgi:hypothetical protein